ncbi:hypothetical protein TSUD_207530 [Trifolium subterraneum]|uniref:Uncharacterized protein n=1 Tax=Trifolium subterraneum TaxID=3900 RepID=A0A2Z6P3U5_TRISU|nr:hypothetical protein TSUD_207530 [Trifolium subterraneum]
MQLVAARFSCCPPLRLVQLCNADFSTIVNNTQNIAAASCDSYAQFKMNIAAASRDSYPQFKTSP